MIQRSCGCGIRESLSLCWGATTRSCWSKRSTNVRAACEHGSVQSKMLMLLSCPHFVTAASSPVSHPLSNLVSADFQNNVLSKQWSVQNLGRRICSCFCCHCWWFLISTCDIPADVRTGALLFLRLFIRVSNLLACGLFQKYRLLVFIYIKEVPRNSRHRPMLSLVRCYTNIEWFSIPFQVHDQSKREEQTHTEHNKTTSLYHKILPWELLCLIR